MQTHKDYMQNFLDSVCKEIKFRGIHNNIVKELSDHIEDQKNVFISQNIDEETAVIKAIEQMGDPIIIGKQLNNAHRPKTEWSILSLVTVIVILGGIVQYLLSSVTASGTDSLSHFILYVPVGIAIFTITYYFDYTLLGRYSKVVYFILFAISIIGFFSSSRISGAYTHIYYVMLLYIPAFAGIIYGFKNKGYLGVVFSGIFYSGVASMCILAHSLSSFFLFSIACLIVLTVSISKGFFGGNKKVSLLIVYIPALLGFIAVVLNLVMSNPYRAQRIVSMINSINDPMGYGWQHLMIRKLVTSSKPFGQVTIDGIAQGMRIDQVLPCWDTDFSLTFIIARFGYLAGIVIVLLMLVLIVRMSISVLRQKNAYGFLVSLAACVAISSQIVLYILTNLGVIAPLGITLPFVSFGAYGFIVNMTLLGLLLSVYRRSDLVNDKLQNVHSRDHLFTVVDGKLIIDLGIRTSSK